MKQHVPELRFKEFEGEWEEKRLGELSRFSKGKGISKSDISDDGTLDCIRYGELYTHYGETISETRSKTKGSAESLVLSEANDIIIPASGESQIDLARASCVLKSGIALGGDINIIKTDCDGIFLSYYLNSKKRMSIATLAQGVSVVHLYPSQLALLDVSYPTLSEQQKIASFLTAVDARLQLLRQQKALLEEYKKGLMQRIFSQELRFKDEDGREFEAWEEKRLGEVLVEHKTRNEDYAVKEVFSVAKHRGVVNQIEHLGRSFASKELGNYKVVFPDDIVYTKSPTSDFPFGIIKQNKLERTGIVSVLYGVFTPVNKFIGLLLDYYFSDWKNTYNYLNRLVQKGAKNTMNINNNEFLNGATISLPSSIAEQQKIARFLSAIDEKINLVAAQIAQTETWKKGLMQGMFV